MWLDGRPYWDGLQMDETALPILLVDLLRREAPACFRDCHRWWPMVRKAAAFIVANGPVTQQDRWEEDGGYSPFTLAAEVSALLVAADMAQAIGQIQPAEFLRQIADTWNDNIERWTYAVNSDSARQIGVEGYYVRITPPDTDGAASPLQGFVPIKNRPVNRSNAPAVEIVSPDALALVRFGLRAPDDPRILNTIKVIDALLRVTLPQGPGWYRYNCDGYGEHEDGSPFDGTGVGRVWPLLAGERAHYELAAGHPASAEALLGVMENSTGDSRLVPEQVWDADDIPVRELLVHQAAALAARRKDLRSATPNRRTLSGKESIRDLLQLALQQQAAHASVWKEGAPSGTGARSGALESRWLANRARRGFRRERLEPPPPGFADRNSRSRPPDRLHVLLEKRPALGGTRLPSDRRVVGDDRNLCRTTR